MNVLLPVFVPLATRTRHFIDIRLEVLQTGSSSSFLIHPIPKRLARGINLQRLLRNLPSFSFAEILEGPHVMEPVRQLDEGRRGYRPPSTTPFSGNFPPAFPRSSEKVILPILVTPSTRWTTSFQTAALVRAGRGVSSSVSCRRPATMAVTSVFRWVNRPPPRGDGESTARRIDASALHGPWPKNHRPGVRGPGPPRRYSFFTRSIN